MQKYWKEFFEKHGYTVDENYNINKKIEDEYYFEIIFHSWKKKKTVSVFLWSNQGIRGRILNASVKEPFEEYEEFLKKCWFDFGQDLYLDFENSTLEFDRLTFSKYIENKVKSEGFNPPENMINNAFEELGLIPGTIGFDWLGKDK